METDHPIISADSHITEGPQTYIDYIDPKYRDRAPRVVSSERGDLYVIDGMEKTIPMGLVAAAGTDPDKISTRARYEDLHRSGYDANYRIADQSRDGISCEVIYPSVGMVLCAHPDLEYKSATMKAYNRWLAEYCSVDPHRLVGNGQTALRTPDEGIADLEEIKRQGFKGVMLPAEPGIEDYDSPAYDEFWEACCELELVPAFHVLTGSGARNAVAEARGSKLNTFMPIVWANQGIMGMLVLGAVFERHPRLHVVCVEADAGWAPHFAHRMDSFFNRHSSRLKGHLSKAPSVYFHEHIYMTFQDDLTAFQNVNHMNWRRLCWANDFPHSDSTWPWSQRLLDSHTADITAEQRRAILCDNTADLYQIDVSRLPVGGDALVRASA